MYVGEVIAIAREWMERHGRDLPGCQAAHLVGSLTGLPHNSIFAAYRDVDISIVSSVEHSGEAAVLDIPYRGLIIECGFHSLADYRSAGKLLAHPGLAAHLAVDCVLYDPDGLLATVQPIVARDYRRRRWVLERCEAEKRDTLRLLEQAERAEAPGEYMLALYSLVGMALCGLLMVATLQAPTHRRCLVLARDLLYERDRPELYEALLDLLGHATLSRAEVERWLALASVAFDRAVAVKRSPSPFGFKFKPHVRPYLIDGARELIEQGLHREAMWWLGFVYFASNAVIQNDGDAGEQPDYQARLCEFLGPLASETATERRGRVLRARRLADALFTLADQLVAHNPLVVM